MKKIVTFLLIAAFGLLTVKTQAQARSFIVPAVNQGTYTDLGGIYPTITQDSLQVSDSIAYIVPVLHTGKVIPYLNWQWTKIGAGTATVTLSFLQGNDPTNLFPIKAGVGQTTYTKTYTLSATTPEEVDFARDTAQFNGRYLKIYFITSNTASVKGKLAVRLKTNIQ